MIHVASLKAERAALKEKAEALVNDAISSKKDLTGTNLEHYNGYVAQIKTIDANLTRHEQLAAFGTPQTPTDRPVLFSEDGNSNGKPTIFGRTDDGREIPIFAKGQSIAAHLA